MYFSNLVINDCIFCWSVGWVKSYIDIPSKSTCHGIHIYRRCLCQCFTWEYPTYFMLFSEINKIFPSLLRRKKNPSKDWKILNWILVFVILENIPVNVVIHHSQHSESAQALRLKILITKTLVIIVIFILW